MPEAKVVAYDLGCKEIDELKAAGYQVVPVTTTDGFLNALKDGSQIVAMVVDCAIALPALMSIFLTDMNLFLGCELCPNFFVITPSEMREESWWDHQVVGIFYVRSVGEVVDITGYQLSRGD